MEFDFSSMGRFERTLAELILRSVLAYAWLRRYAAALTAVADAAALPFAIMFGMLPAWGGVTAAFLILLRYDRRRRVHWVGATEPVETRPR